ncbi:MAG: S1 RNA-binding domain-containing protein [Dehalococcoidia bacterium]|nr:S1 RNA-binding domain-containing protein [Dehalococcoidia bacterium]
MATGLIPIIGPGPSKDGQATDSGMDGWEQLSQGNVMRSGEIVAGTVVSVGNDGMWVSVGCKSEGFVPPGEMRSVINGEGFSVEIGNEVLVYILNTEDEAGHPVLSVDRAEREKNWKDLGEKLAANQPIEVILISYNKGGFLANYGRVRGFVPLSQLSPSTRVTLNNEDAVPGLAGKSITVKILELDRDRNRLILSEMLAQKETRELQKEQFFNEINEGDVRKGMVTGIHPFGVFINLGAADGLIPLSELSWQSFVKPSDVINVGNEVDVLVLKMDKEAKKILLSTKRIQPSPWQNMGEKYVVGQLVNGRITRLVDYGAFVKVDEVIDGLIHVSEMADRRIAHPKEVVKTDEVLTMKIISVDTEKHRLRLSLMVEQEYQITEGDSSGEPEKQDNHGE